MGMKTLLTLWVIDPAGENLSVGRSSEIHWVALPDTHALILQKGWKILTVSQKDKGKMLSQQQKQKGWCT